MRAFLVTFERITHESAAEGEAAERGVLLEGVSLREAFCSLEGEAGIEPSEEDFPRWVTAYGSQDPRSGDWTHTALHFPEHLTQSTRRRIVRLLQR